MTQLDSAIQSSRPVAKGAGLALLAMCLGNGLSMFNSTMVNVTLPDVAAELGASETGLQWVSTAYTLCFAAMLLPGGALGNRIGRRQTFLIGIAVFVVGSAGCALAPTLGMLLAARVVQALGVAAMMPQTLSILVNEYDSPTARARAVGIWSGVSAVGLAAGPVIGGLIVGVADWRWGFWLSVGFGVVAWVLAFLVVPRSRHGRVEGAAPIDLPGALLSVVALVALVFGFIESANLGWGSPVIVTSFGIAVLAIAGFLWLEHALGRRGRHPIMPLGIWRSRRLVAANVAGVVYFFLFFGVLYFIGLALQHSGLSALLAGAAFLPMLVIQAILGPIAGRLSSRFGVVRVLLCGFVLAVLGAVLLALLPGDGILLDFEWRMAVVGLGTGLMSSPMSNLAVSSVERIHSSTASAVHNMSRQIGSTLGVSVLGLIPGATEFGPGLQWLMGVVAIVLAAGAVTVWLLTRSGRRSIAA